MKLFGVYGAAGCGRGVMPLVRDQIGASRSDVELVFIDDALGGSRINGHMVVDWTSFVTSEASQKSVCLAIADSRVRERLARTCAENAVATFGVRASNVVVMDDVDIGEGAVLSPFVTITSNIRIGRYFHANLYSYVEHDCVIGDFVTFGPAAKCNGNVVVEDHAYIGAGAVLRQGRPGEPLVVGRGAVVGMGAVVTRSVSAGATVVGNPARPLEAPSG